MSRKLSFIDKQSLIEQAGENRDADWVEQEEELNMQLRAGEIEEYVYWAWLEENPRPSEVAQEQLKERAKKKRKSKKNVQSRIEVLDREALRDVVMSETTIEWSSDFKEGSLVETREGDIGMVTEQYDPTHNRVTKPAHIKAAMVNSYVRLLVNGVVEWHTKLSVSSLTDS